MIPTLAATLTASALGASTWSVAECLIHQNLGHRFAKNRNFFAREHVRHHATTSYFAATSKKVGAAIAATSLIAPVAITTAGVSLGTAFTVGFVVTYGSYEVVHRIAHTRPPTTRYGRWFRKHHFHHHFHNPAKNHGVTSALWDHVFGTHERPGVIRVPEKHAMSWLADPKTGDAKAEFADDYVIVRKPDKRTTSHRTSGVTGAQPSAPNAPITAPVPGRSFSPNASI